MPCDYYNTPETKVKEHIKHNTSDFCLLYNLAAVHYGYHKPAQLVPKIGEFQLSSVTDLEVTDWNEIASISRFWPDACSDVLQQLRQNVWLIIFYLMTTKEPIDIRSNYVSCAIQNLLTGPIMSVVLFRTYCQVQLCQLCYSEPIVRSNYVSSCAIQNLLSGPIMSVVLFRTY
eukprot:jgi/Psemu1/57571/gm1.57571_g